MSRWLTQDGPDESSDSDPDFDALLREAVDDGDLPPIVRLPRPGQVIGDKYRIAERIGRGGMGVVFRAVHTLSAKEVALKWMLRAPTDDHARRRFVREARVAARIDHPNVVNVFDVDQEGESYYLVMELLHGETLGARLDRGTLAVPEAVEILLPALRGVAAAHRAGVVHRDLKPDNIFLCRSKDGSAREAKVLDFGISAMVAADGDASTLTRDGAVLGTPAYMAPEQLQHASAADARTDVYAFGVILYEALAGRAPFDADSYTGLVLAIVQQAPRPLTEVRPDLPAGIEAAVLRALAKAPADRFQSVEALIEALTPFHAPDAGPGRASATPPAAAHSRARALLAAGVIVAVGGAVWTGAPRRSPPPPVGQPSRVTAPASAVPAMEDEPRALPTVPAAEPVRRLAATSSAVPSAGAAGDAHSASRHANAGRASPSARTKPESNPADPPLAPRSGKITVDEL